MPAFLLLRHEQIHKESSKQTDNKNRPNVLNKKGLSAAGEVILRFHVLFLVSELLSKCQAVGFTLDDKVVFE